MLLENPNNTQLHKALECARNISHEINNVKSVYIGDKYVGFVKTPYKCISFRVDKKDFQRNDIPEVILEVLTDVVDDETMIHYSDNDHVNEVNLLMNKYNYLIEKYDFITCIIGGSNFKLDHDNHKVIISPVLEIHVISRNMSTITKTDIINEVECAVQFEDETDRLHAETIPLAVNTHKKKKFICCIFG